MSDDSMIAGADGNGRARRAPSGSQVDWSVFLQEGVIVSITIKRYRGTTTVNFDELGINADDAQLKSFLGEYIRPGLKKLIPPEIDGQLKSIETSARKNLKEKSFDCSAFASNGKFVPKSMYPEFKKVNEELSDRFYAIRDDFASNYSTIVNKVRNDYKVLAESLYKQSHPKSRSVPKAYTDEFVDKIISQIPSSEEIVASFEYKTVLRRIPEYLLDVISQEGKLQGNGAGIGSTDDDEIVIKPFAPDTRKTDKRNTNDNKRYDTDDNVGDKTKEAPLKKSSSSKGRSKNENNNKAGKRLSGASSLPDEKGGYESDSWSYSYDDDVDSSTSTASAAYHQDDGEQEIDEIERDIRQALSEQSEEQVLDFVTDIMMRLRKDAYDGASSIIASIDKNNGKLVGRASMKAHSLIKELRNMNFYNDEELTELIDALELALGENKEDRDVANVREATERLLEWSGVSMKTIHNETVERKSRSASTSQERKSKKRVVISVPVDPKRRRDIKRRT